jgi:hypothetical protein
MAFVECGKLTKKPGPLDPLKRRCGARTAFDRGNLSV